MAADEGATQGMVAEDEHQPQPMQRFQPIVDEHAVVAEEEQQPQPIRCFTPTEDEDAVAAGEEKQRMLRFVATEDEGAAPGALTKVERRTPAAPV